MAHKKVTVETTGKVDDSELEETKTATEEGKKKSWRTKVPLEAFLQTLDDHAKEQCTVVVGRIGPRAVDGRKVRLGSFFQIPISDFGEADPMDIIDNVRVQIEQEHGMGSYNCTLRNGSGKILRTWSFEVLSGEMPEEDFAPGTVAAAPAAGVKPGTDDVQNELDMEKDERRRLLAKREIKRLKKANHELAEEVEPANEFEPEEPQDPRAMMSNIDEMATQIEAKVRKEYEDKAKEDRLLNRVEQLVKTVEDLRSNPPTSRGGGEVGMLDKVITLMVTAQESNTKLLVEALKPRVEQPPQAQLPPVIEQLVQAAINRTLPAEGSGDGAFERALASVSQIVGLKNDLGLPFGSAPAEPTPWWQTLIENFAGPVSEFIAIRKMELQNAKPGLSDAEIDKIVRDQVAVEVAKVQAQHARAMAKQGQQPFAKTPAPPVVQQPQAPSVPVHAPAEQTLPPQSQQQRFQPPEATLPANAPLPGVRTEQVLPTPQHAAQTAPGGNGEIKVAMAGILARLQEELKTLPPMMTWIPEMYRSCPSVAAELEADTSDAGLTKTLQRYANPLTLMHIATAIKGDPQKEAWFNTGLNAWREHVDAAKEDAQISALEQGGIVPSGDDDVEGADDGAGQQAAQ